MSKIVPLSEIYQSTAGNGWFDNIGIEEGEVTVKMRATTARLKADEYMPCGMDDLSKPVLDQHYATCAVHGHGLKLEPAPFSVGIIRRSDGRLAALIGYREAT